MDLIGHPHEYLMVLPAPRHPGEEGGGSDLLDLLDLQTVADIRLLPRGPLCEPVQELVRAQPGLRGIRSRPVDDLELIVRCV